MHIVFHYILVGDKVKYYHISCKALPMSLYLYVHAVLVYLVLDSQGRLDFHFNSLRIVLVGLCLLYR